MNFYVLGTIPFSIREILVRGCFSLQDTKTPMINGVIVTIINIILNIILVKHFGIGGLGLATSISGTISILLLLHTIKRKIGSIKQREFTRDIIKMVLASMIMGVVIFGHKISYNNSSMYTNVIFIIVLGIFTYFLSMTLLDVKEFKKGLQGIKRMLRI